VLAIDAEILRQTGTPGFGVTAGGFVVKPFARLLAEKLALARALIGDIDLGSGSLVRKILELSALEDMRTWAALGAMYENSFASSATGEALGRIGEELGLPRPFLQATGKVKLTLTGSLPGGRTEITVPRGARLSTPGGHHVATEETVVLSPASPERTTAVAAFYPGPSHNLDPAQPAQKIDRWNRADPAVAELDAAEQAAGAVLVTIAHTEPLRGGELRWPDTRYRELLLRAPRSVWTVDAVRAAISLVPGVRQVQVRDGWGGLDLNQSIFGNFHFVERLFGSERDLASPYYFTVLVAPTPAAIWDGPDGLHTAVQAAIEDLRPMGIFPRIERAQEVGVGIAADLIVQGLPLPSGSRAAVNGSTAGVALRQRLLDRVRPYVDGTGIGIPVRAAEAIWALMNEPGIADVRDLRLLRYPPGFDATVAGAAPPTTLQGGQNIDLQANEVAVFVDDFSRLQII